MGLDAEIAKIAGVETINRGSSKLIASSDALQVIDACAAKKFLILGMDVFVLSGSSVISDLDAIADFSGATWQESINLAKQFVEATRRSELRYEFVIEPGQVGNDLSKNN